MPSRLAFVRGGIRRRGAADQEGSLWCARSSSVAATPKAGWSKANAAVIPVSGLAMAEACGIEQERSLAARQRP